MAFHDKRILTADEAALRIQDGHTVAIGGSGAGHSIPEALLAALGRRYRATESPRGLTLVHPFGVGNQGDRGLEPLACPGLFRRVIGGHWSMSPSMAKLAARDQFEAYCLPAGIIVQLFHCAAAGSPGWLSTVGLSTFVDPRVEGGKLNGVTREDLVEVVTRDGREYLFYKTTPIDVALIKASTADTAGNLSMDEEVAPWHNCARAHAATAAGGLTLAQVRRVVAASSLDPRRVRVPGIFVDALVVDPALGMTYTIDYDPTLSGELRRSEDEFAPFPFSLRKVVARRAALELSPGAILNVGFGMPDGVIKVAREQGFAGQLIPTIEQGQIGGIPAEGLEFGAMYNATSIIETGHQFAFYHGRGVDIAFLGFVEVDPEGNVNVSRMENAIIGTGGFIDIAQRARRLVFCGTLAVKGQFESTGAGLRPLAAGSPKFVPRVRQVTFSGRYARRSGQEVHYVTEAAVFRLESEGLTLIEIAPGLDLERDLLPQLGFRPRIASPLPVMAPELYSAEPLPARLFPRF
jgi:acyl CoA:acetate/3-ketoacid CoA transferase